MRKQKTETWYTRQIIYLNKLIEQEENGLIRWMLTRVKKHYTRKYETLYDEASE